MTKDNPIEFSKKFLDQRNDLTGPSDGGKTGHPKPPKHVNIKSDKNS